MTRTRMMMGALAIGLAGLLGTSACTPGASSPAEPAVEAPAGAPAQPAADPAADLAPEAQALRAVGFTTELEPSTGPPAEASAGANPAGEQAGEQADKAGEKAGDRTGRKGKRGKKSKARRLLRKNTLHGEITVQTKNGVRTIAVQRGTVTAVDGDSVSVKSADGFTATWAFGDKLRVVKDKAKVEPGAVTVGAEVGVAGARGGETFTARLVRLS